MEIPERISLAKGSQAGREEKIVGVNFCATTPNNATKTPGTKRVFFLSSSGFFRCSLRFPVCSAGNRVAFLLFFFLPSFLLHLSAVHSPNVNRSRVLITVTLKVTVMMTMMMIITVIPNSNNNNHDVSR